MSTLAGQQRRLHRALLILAEHVKREVARQLSRMLP